MSFSLKLDVSTSDMSCAYSITQFVVDKIKDLQHSFKTITDVEISLFENGSRPDCSKAATLTINDSVQKTFVETCSSKNWEDAVLSAYEKIEGKFLTIVR
jgi:ribosome-associated translation inhibitor RaiA